MGLLGISKKGKWMIGGICAFAIIATASTGLAAWVIGQNTGATASGTINVEKNVTDKSITLDVTSTTENLTVKFGPKEGTWDVVNPSDPTASEEKLDFTISGTATLADANTTISTVSVELSIPADSRTAVKALVDNEYIALPSGTGSIGDAFDGTISLGTIDVTATDSDTVKSFTKKFSFAWGSKFDGQNPCEFYTSDTENAYSEAKAALTALSTYTASASYTITLSV